jgi:hypothetical protein
MLPLSALTANVLVSPLIETSSRMRRAFEMWPVPVARWQSLQWHWPMVKGGTARVKLTAPHWHRPVANGLSGTSSSLIAQR